MNMTKLCCVFNIAPRYRKNIYTVIDREYDCEWYFHINKTDVKGLDLNLLKKATEVDYIRKGNWYWQKGIVGLVGRKDINNFLILGEPYCLSMWALLLIKNLFYRSKKVYVWTHGWYGKETFVRKILKKVFFGLADRLFLYGNYAKKLMIEEGFKPETLHVIHNSLDYDNQLAIRRNLKPESIYREHFQNDNKTIIFIGRLTKVKRLDMLIEAVSRLKAKGEDYNLVIVGDGTERQSLEKHAKAIAENVWFYGACYDEIENAKLIYNADLCVSPGNVGLTAVHCLSFGTPVASHSDFKNQMPEFEAIIEGKTGTYFEYGKIDSMVESISRWFANHQDDREKVRQACYHEIDTQWTPYFQLDVLKSVFK